MLKEYYMAEDEDIGEALTELIEKETQRKIFTMRTFDHKYTPNALEAIVIFEDKAVMLGTIAITRINGKLAARCKLSLI
jgi:hypothetical protein